MTSGATGAALTSADSTSPDTTSTERPVDGGVKPSPRLPSIDLLRGLIMVLMVLDHARDFFTGNQVRPTDLTETNGILFFTRWFTHFCAPGFVFLAGTAIYLAARRRTPGERTRFLATRGLFLVLLELTVVKFGWAPEPFYYFVILQVIWAIGWSMVAMAALTYLPSRALLLLGAVALALAPLWENSGAGVDGPSGVLLTLLTGRGRYEPVDGHMIMVGYAILPWLAVMMVGYGFGEVATQTPDRFRKVSFWSGVGLTVCFVVLRGLNVYGDPNPWSEQGDAAFTVLSFLNLSKYPPSLLYLLMTLGPLLMVLALLTRFDARQAPWRWLHVFGRVPLFFYVAHLWLLRFASIGCAIAVWGLPDAYLPPPDGHAGCPEWPLYATYIAWALSLVVLYVPSRAFAALKRRRNDWWLAYL